MDDQTKQIIASWHGCLTKSAESGEAILTARAKQAHVREEDGIAAFSIIEKEILGTYDMRFNCFRPAGVNSVEQQHRDLPARTVSLSSPGHAKKRSRVLRHGSADSRVSTVSNESVSKLPPCTRSSDPKIEAMMMPVPPEPRASCCLRLSQPKTYSNIVDSMKACKGCRDWRNFDVFHADDVDTSISAEQTARKRALDCQRRIRMFNSFSTGDESGESIDTIE